MDKYELHLFTKSHSQKKEMYVILNSEVNLGSIRPKSRANSHKTPTKEIENTFLGSWEM